MSTSFIQPFQPASHPPSGEFRRVLFPMGFSVELETNSESMLMLASQAWSRYPDLSQAAPVRIRIHVSKAALSSAAGSPRIDFDQEKMWVDHGAGNCATADLAGGWGRIDLTEDRAADLDYVNYYFLKPLTYLLLAPRNFAFVHAACIARNGRAVVLCGDASAGKTCLAFACARLGWSFLSGDATHLLHNSSGFEVAGRPFSIRFRESARELFPELAHWPARIRPNQKPAVEVDTSKLKIATAVRAHASHFVFLERRAAGNASLGPVSPGEAERRLQESVFFGDEEIRRQQRATLSHFASLPVMRLTYSELNDAEGVLRSLIPDVV